MPTYSRLDGPTSPIGSPAGYGPAGGIGPIPPNSYSSASGSRSASSGASSSSGARRGPPQRYNGSSPPFSRSAAPADALSSQSHGSEGEQSGLLSNQSGMGNSSNASYAPRSAPGSRHYDPPGAMGGSSTGASGGIDAGRVYSHQRNGSKSSGHSGASGSVAASRYAMGPSSYFAAANAPEADDYLHVPDTKGDKNHGVSFGGCLNIATLIILALSLLMLFAGYPILSHFMSTSDFFSKLGIGLGGTNSSGQIPQLPTRLLVDTSTPDTARVWTNIDQQTYTLVFSDEFEQEGRTFWPGDDPYWEAVDIWYGATGDYEWYSPEAINTTGGHLVITMTAQETHNLNFQSGMLQSWNKFCFQGGYIEFSLLQPGGPSTSGYWPAAWLMGNLARPGYLGSTDGMWPYSYSSCDTGILPNQTFLNQTGPEKAIHSKAKYAKNGQLSRLSGMRAPACTCKGQDHPGPNNNVGRSAPEIDIIEAQIQSKDGSQHSFASQSIQTAPFDVEYFWGNKSTQAILYNSDTVINTYHGSVYQEAVSSVTQCPDDNFPTTGGRFVRYGVEYEPDWNKNGGGFTRWYVDGKATWEVKGSALGPVPELDIGQRLIPAEPMSIIMNLGMSSGFQPIDFTKAGVSFPAQMKFDYVRLYQQGQPKVSCDPSDYPTADYIKRHPNLYTNPNLTRFDAPFPLNKLTAAANGVDC